VERVENKLLKFLEKTTCRAGSIILGYYNGKFEIDKKDLRPEGIDIVTDADRASESFILNAIKDEFPGHDILTEESQTEIGGSSSLWLVDPLDGTVNFAHGFPHFSVSIALMDHGNLLAGAVYDPLRGEFFCALKGCGSWLNQKAIYTSESMGFRSSLLGTGFPYDIAYSEDNNVREFSRMATKVQGIRRAGSAALDLAYVACGRLDGFWELKLKPWDQGAGMLLVEEAGGKITDRFGKPVDPFSNTVVATNGLIHDQVVQVLEES
jgi:myo-inositol-1(or 4)-monophosphatase